MKNVLAVLVVALSTAGAKAETIKNEFYALDRSYVPRQGSAPNCRSQQANLTNEEIDALKTIGLDDSNSCTEPGRDIRGEKSTTVEVFFKGNGMTGKMTTWYAIGQ